MSRKHTIIGMLRDFTICVREKIESNRHINRPLSECNVSEEYFHRAFPQWERKIVFLCLGEEQEIMTMKIMWAAVILG